MLHITIPISIDRFQGQYLCKVFVCTAYDKWWLTFVYGLIACFF